MMAVPFKAGSCSYGEVFHKEMYLFFLHFWKESNGSVLSNSQRTLLFHGDNKVHFLVINYKREKTEAEEEMTYVMTWTCCAHLTTLKMTLINKNKKRVIIKRIKQLPRGLTHYGMSCFRKLINFFMEWITLHCGLFTNNNLAYFIPYLLYTVYPRFDRVVINLSG